MQQGTIRKAVESIEIKADVKDIMLQNCKQEVKRRQGLPEKPTKIKKLPAWIPITAVFAASVILCSILFFRVDRQHKYVLETKFSDAPYLISVLSCHQGNILENAICSEITELEPQSIGASNSGFLFSLTASDQTVMIFCPANTVLVFNCLEDFLNGVHRTPATEYTLQGGEIIAWVADDSGVIKISNAQKDRCLQVISVQKRFWDESKTTYYASSYPICEAREIVKNGAYTTNFVFLEGAIEYTVENIVCKEDGNCRLYDITVLVQNKTAEKLCLYTGNAVLSDLSLLGSIEPTAVYEDDCEVSNVILNPNETKQIRFAYDVPVNNSKELYFSLNPEGTTSTKTEVSSWMQYFELPN